MMALSTVQLMKKEYGETVLKNNWRSNRAQFTNHAVGRDIEVTKIEKQFSHHQR
jgi:hypothetical protein